MRARTGRYHVPVPLLPLPHRQLFDPDAEGRALNTTPSCLERTMPRDSSLSNTAVASMTGDNMVSATIDASMSSNRLQVLLIVLVVVPGRMRSTCGGRL